MKCTSRSCRLTGTVRIPGSKSHTIRGVLLASLADGESVLRDPLRSADTDAAVAVYSGLGARFQLGEDAWHIHGCGNTMAAPPHPLDVRNSGTTMRVALGSCALLAAGTAEITGDNQIQRRPCGPLVDALNALGGQVRSLHDNGCAPFRVGGLLRGGRVTIESRTSQYLTSLLLACPLADGDTEIDVPLLYEKPYVRMTLDWLEAQGVRLEYTHDFSAFRITGRQRFRPLDRPIPADFSSATFFLVAGALRDNDITCTGLDMNDSQSDRAVVGFLRDMGADVTVTDNGIRVRGRGLHGIDMDLNDCPDALPMLAVAGCFATGTTRLLNVPQARIKETDRIAVMCRELTRLGADIEELPDGLVIRESPLRAAAVQGHHDHRIVMALTVAGSAAAGDGVTVDTAEAADVTFPQFWELFRHTGGDAALHED